MKTRVKICGHHKPAADAPGCRGGGSRRVGVQLQRAKPAKTDNSGSRSISRQLAPFVLRVGVFVDATEEQVTRALRECGLGMLQFHGAEKAEFCTQFGTMSMKAFRIRDAESLKEMPKYNTDAWLLDAFSPAARGGTGETFDWALAVEAQKLGKPVFLAGGLTPENVAAAVRQVRPFGVDVASGVESSPGKKDPARMRAFIQAVRSVE